MSINIERVVHASLQLQYLKEQQDYGKLFMEKVFPLFSVTYVKKPISASYMSIYLTPCDRTYVNILDPM